MTKKKVNPPVNCLYCGKVVLMPRGGQLYCRDYCKERAYKMRKTPEGALELEARKRDRQTHVVSRGSVFRRLVEMGLDRPLMEGTLTQAEVAEALDVSRAQVGKALAALKEGRNVDPENWDIDGNWVALPMFSKMLGPKAAPEEEARYEGFLDEMVEAFISFRDTFFEVSRGTRYMTAPCHRRWIRAVLTALYRGGRLMILSPPRHGKTDLMIHFVVWCIVRNPNFRAVWVAASSPIASDMVGAVREILEYDERLRSAFLPPGTFWAKQSRAGKPWTGDKFFVINRTISGAAAKAPTMLARGRGSSILNLDVDLICMDDIEDDMSVATPGGRAQTRVWAFKTVGSRKMEHTAQVVTGSRQHYDDWYGYVLEDDQWTHIVEKAHQPCEADERDMTAHDEHMLVPELRSYRWWKGMQRTALNQGELNTFMMVYQNEVSSEDSGAFSEAKLIDARDFSRVLGTEYLSTKLPDGSMTRIVLLAGLDPSPGSHQARFLWGLDMDLGTLYMVDAAAEERGGTSGFLAAIRDWHQRWGVSFWEVEENGWQKGLKSDPETAEYISKNGIQVEGHETWLNKHDPQYGIAGIAKLFDDGKIVLPYGDEESRALTDMFISQCLRWDPNDTQRTWRQTAKRRRDLLMAAWFPLKVIRRWIDSAATVLEMDYDSHFPGADVSDYDTTPWSSGY